MCNKTLLIVDDDDALTQVLARAFKRRGFEAFTAHTGQQALELCQLQQPNFCILDLKIAQESGLNLIPQLLAVQSHINIVMLTGYSSINTAVEAIKLGANHYLCKPADADEIEQAFSRAVGDPNANVHNTPPSVNRLEWEHIQKVLADHEGNVSATARALGMHRRTLQRKLQKKPVRS